MRSNSVLILLSALFVLTAGSVVTASAEDVSPRRDPLKEIDANSRNSNRDIRVQITAKTSTTIGASMTGRLARFPLRDGDHFKAGQTLAHFDCGVAEGAAARAHAAQDKKKSVLATAQQLRQLGSNSGLELDVATAEAREAAAEVSASQAVLARCDIQAPFSGRVSNVIVHEYQYVTEGTPLLEILDDHELEMELIVPSSWLIWLKPGSRFAVTVDETGHTYQAELIRLSGKVDAVTQSIKVYGRIVGAAPELLPGMSGNALLKPPTSP
jgi:RND family efflux transporter MFP subunit